MPIAMSLYTPWPLMVLAIIRIIYLKRCKKQEQKEITDTESNVNASSLKESPISIKNLQVNLFVDTFI